MKEKIKNKIYEWWHGHPFLLEEEVDIIIKARESECFKYYTESQIQWLIKKQIKDMYIEKFGCH